MLKKCHIKINLFVFVVQSSCASGVNTNIHKAVRQASRLTELTSCCNKHV